METRCWTTRPNVHLRGLTPQGVTYNLLHELLDLRVLEYCQRHKLNPMETALPVSFVTDGRHSVFHQLQDGRFCCLENSWPYAHLFDRGLVPIEFFFNMGWGQVDISQVHVKVPGLEEAAIGSLPPRDQKRI